MPDPTPPAPPDEAKTFTQADVDKIVADRIARERAKFSDYDDMKAKASKLDELEAANRSDVEKATQRIADAERKAQEAEAKALRLEVAAEKGVKPRWLTGSTREELEAAADEYLTDHPPAEGGSTTPPRKPVEELKGGGDPTAPTVETNPAKLAESVPRL